MQRKGINFKWPGVVFGEHTAAEKLRVFVSNLSGGGGGEKGESWSSSAGSKYLLSLRSFQRGSCRGEMASHLCSTLELICSAAFRSLTCPPPNPPTGPRQGAFNGAAGEVGPQRSGELNDDRMGMISHVSRRVFFYFL